MREEILLAGQGITANIEQYLDEPLETEMTDHELELARRRRIAEQNQSTLTKMGVTVPRGGQ